MVEAANQDGEGAATVGQVNLELRMAVEHAAEDQGGTRRPRSQTDAEQVREVIGLGAIASQRGQRMQKTGRSSVSMRAKTGSNNGSSRSRPLDVCAQIDAAHARQFAGAIEFINGVIVVTHRQGQEGNKPRRIGEMRGPRAVVPRLGELEGNLRIAPIIHRRRE